MLVLSDNPLKDAAIRPIIKYALFQGTILRELVCFDYMFNMFVLTCTASMRDRNDGKRVE